MNIYSGVSVTGEEVENESGEICEAQFSDRDIAEEFPTEYEVSFHSLPSVKDEIKSRVESGKVTDQHLKDISRELGLIKLCWPEVPEVDYDERIHYPHSFMTNSKKEKLLLWYAENFREQFIYKFPDRRPLLIACENECGVQKMVCTTIRPTKLAYLEFQTWQGCANFVADHLTYESLDNPTVLPDRLNSPQTVMRRQAGHAFEYATLLASLLIGASYDAYVVSGYATREVCRKDQTRVDCPYLEDDAEEEEEEPVEEDSKYFFKKPPELKSKFLADMEAKETLKQNEADKAQEAAEIGALKDYERPWPDELWTWRLHSWVLVLPSGDVTEPFFIETTTGMGKPIDDPDYHGIESIWNNHNYWVLVQFDRKTEVCTDISFDLNNGECWEKFLIGEPINKRRLPKRFEHADEEEFKQAWLEAEKHLDLPFSWVDALELTNGAYERRFPNAKKITYYRKAISERFPPYSHTDGLVERVTTYHDYECYNPKRIRERFECRADKMYFCERMVADNSVFEKFARGREDCLKEHFYYSMDSGIEVKFVLVFYHEARLDKLSKIMMDPLFMTIYYEDRPDFLYYVHIIFQERDNEDQPWRYITNVTEKFHRNPELEADKDVAEVEFLYQEKKLKLKFHYETDHVTQTTRWFQKPAVAERGARLTFDPALTAGYLTGPNTPQPKPLYLYKLQVKWMREEEIVEKKIRDRENELIYLLRQRAQELAAPRLNVEEYDTERNTEALELYKELQKQKLMEEERELSMTWDMLVPFFSKYGIPPKAPLPEKLAKQLINECLQDWKNLLVTRANNMQQKFEKTCQEFYERNNWFDQNQSAITKEQEEEYFEYCKKQFFFLHILELRLKRHKEQAPSKFLRVHSYLKADPRLASAFQIPLRRRHKR